MNLRTVVDRGLHQGDGTQPTRPATADAPPALAVDPQAPVSRVLRDLRSRTEGLSQREAERRLVVFGPNELVRTGHRSWRTEVLRQLTHPLALLLWAAAAMSAATHSTAVSAAIVAVIVVNAAFAFVQEQQAERAVELLGRLLPVQATVVRDGTRRVVAAADLVPGDVLVITEGDRVSADARLLQGAVEIDSATLTGESLPVYRSADATGPEVAFLEARDLVFSGTTCTGGEATGVVFATGMRTELGRIAALSQRVTATDSPLERQVRRVAWVIALVAVGVGVAFLPLGTLVAGLSFASASVFAIGLLVGNVPEGLLPTITLALGVGVRILARNGALVKRLSAVETLGSTTVICTDKTGTLTQNRMRVTSIWACGIELAAGDVRPGIPALGAIPDAVAACNSAALESASEAARGDPTELALLIVAERAGAEVDLDRREARRRRLFHFDPGLKLMSTIDADGDALWVHTKGAPESVLPLCDSIADADGAVVPLTPAARMEAATQVETYAAKGLRVLAVARRQLTDDKVPTAREDAEQRLCFLGLVAMFDPPRPEVADAVARCHEAGIRIVVVTGDHPLTATEIARQVGISTTAVVTGAQLDQMSDDALDALLRTEREIVFARNSPEAKLRIADALRAQGEVVAMTGDGVNDAPALRAADIGVAMGVAGTDVARDAATMVLTDDNFATITRAIEEGRRVYDNVRKFMFYIFVHATPEVAPFLVFALSGGSVPLPLTVLQILAIDLGTETLPALALGREPAEPGLMRRPPRPRSEGVIRAPMLVRAWLFLGAISAALCLGGFFAVLANAGWSPGSHTGAGTALHHAYLQATTMTFLGIVACQVGTAFAARTQRASLRAVGVLTNPLLLWGIGFELAFAAVITGVPGVHGVFGTWAPPLWAIGVLPAYPLIVWGSDELRRYLVRRRAGTGG